MARGCKNQISLFDYKPQDKTTDKNGNTKPADKWQNYKRCENCERWNLINLKEQPPDGWGVLGWCPSLTQRVEKNSFCMNYEDKNEM